ncbi:MAG: acyltransferase [Wenzhouxiangellaceae bacterium]|nr:acyltransferase [Wenzhouxiangellaceae bacterium]
MSISSLSAALRSAIAIGLISLNTIVHVLPLMAVALAKAVLRFARLRKHFDHWLVAIAENWIGVNSWMFDHLTSTRIEIEGLPEPQPNGHLLVICNHQSWVDIPLLQKVFNHRLPFLRFFIKSQLIWVPLLGQAWWAMDFPFMKRYTKEQLKRRPELVGRDIEATRKACEKYRHIPTSMMNFVEGTRFTPAKRSQQQSPHEHLLKPRSGGIAFVLEAMADSIDRIVDVTVAYPGWDARRPSLVDLCANRIREIRISIRTMEVPAWVRGLDYQGNPDDRRRFQDWVNQLWSEKDQRLDRLLDPLLDRAPG